MKKLTRIIVTLCTSSLFLPSYAANKTISWPQFKQTLWRHVKPIGISEQQFQVIYKNFQPKKTKKVYFEAKHQPELHDSFKHYRHKLLNHARVKRGQEALAKNQVLLRKITKDFHVDANIIVALWGLESDYGQHIGAFNLFHALTSLAFTSPRHHFFYTELIDAFKILKQQPVSWQQMKSSWAGGMGQPQFIPSSWLEYAVDFDHNGHKDIWHNKADSLASIANFLHKNGWHWQEPTYLMVSSSKTLPRDYFSHHKIEPLIWWLHHGIKLPLDKNLQLEWQGNLLRYKKHHYIMALHNLRVIHRWNHSWNYATVASNLAQAISQKPV